MEKQRFASWLRQVSVLTRRQRLQLMIARDRTGGTHDVITGRGAVAKDQLHLHLLPVLAPMSCW